MIKSKLVKPPAESMQQIVEARKRADAIAERLEASLRTLAEMLTKEAGLDPTVMQMHIHNAQVGTCTAGVSSQMIPQNRPGRN